MADDNRTQQVSLGCGTLILIALIVLIFSGRGTGDLEREVHGLRSEIRELKKSVESQTAEIKSVQQKLDRQPGAPKDK
jgi:Sec-independent protein translocase protein TatA